MRICLNTNYIYGGINVKNISKISLLIAGVSMLFGSGVFALKNVKQPVKTSAESSNQIVSFTKVREGYFERSDDPSGGLSTLSLSSSAFTGAKHQDTVSSGHIGVSMGETSSNGKWHGVFMEYSYTFAHYAYSKTTLNFTYSLSSNRDQTSGEADHVMEIIHEGYGSSSSHSYTLGCGADSPQTVSSPTPQLLGGPTAYRVNSRTSGTVSTSNQSFSRSLSNETASDSNYTFYVAFFCYIESSKYNHIQSATGSLDLTITTSYYDAEYTAGSTSGYADIVGSWNTVNSNANGGTIKLLRDCTISGGLAVNKNVTLNLNGHTIARNGTGDPFTSIFGVSSGVTFNVTNNNNQTPGYVSVNNGFCVINVGNGGTLTISGGARIKNTCTVAGNGNGVYADGGTINLQSSTIDCVDSSTLGNACVMLKNGATFNMTGGNINGGTYSIRSYSSTTPKDVITLAGTCSIQNKLYIPSTSVCTLQFYYNSSNTFNPSTSSNVNIEFGTLPNVNAAFASGYGTTGSSIYSKIRIVNAPSYMTITYQNPNFLYVYRQYTVNFNLSNLEASNISGTGNHGSNYTATLSPTDSKIYARPATITVNRSTETLVAGTDYSYNQNTGLVTIFAESFTGTYNLSIVARAALTNMGKAYGFIDTYMHLGDYTEEKGWCKDNTHNYYGQAKQAFNALEADVRSLFASSNDSKVDIARARLEAWAAANGESLEFDDTNGYILQTAISLSTYDDAPDSGFTILVVMIVVVLMSFTSFGIVVIKRKKQFHK